MSSPGLIERLTPSTEASRVKKLLPWLALFVRLSVGFGFLNSGLMTMSSNNFGTGGGAFEPVLGLFPFLQVGVGLGLICGIFTTVMAILAWLLLLALPIISTIGFLAAGSAGLPNQPSFRGGGIYGIEGSFMLLVMTVVATPCFALLLLISPLPLNKYSLDALMFQPPKLPLLTPPRPPIAVEPVEEDFPPPANG